MLNNESAGLSSTAGFLVSASNTAIGLCLSHGPGILSLRECLEILMMHTSSSRPSGTPGAWHLLTQGVQGKEEERAFFSCLEESRPYFLRNVQGLSSTERARLMVVFEIARRYLHFKNRPKLKLSILDSSKVARTALKMIDARWRSETIEWLGFVPLFSDGIVGELCTAAYGVRNEVTVSPLELFSKLLALRPRAFFLFHNHPSGKLTPSLQDFNLTMRVEQIAQNLGVEFLGHWIVTETGQREISWKSRKVRKARKLCRR